MHKIFTTEGVPPQKSFRIWRDALHDRFVPAKQTALSDKPFAGKVEGARVGDLAISRVTLDAMKTEVTADTIRRHDKQDTLALLVMLSGETVGHQYDRESVQKAGDISVYDSNSPVTLVGSDAASTFLIEVPRVRLESALGPARLYSSLTAGGALASSRLAVNFLNELVQVQGGMDAALRARMGSIGLDLVIAAVSERMAREVPRALQGDVVVQRAKSYVETNLGDVRLTPDEVAGATGVSLRRLQELFQERGHQVADWIWHRRLRKAAAALADPQSYHLPIGQIAYACGFVNQAHFSTRFKAAYGVSPRDHRQASYAGLARAA